MLRTMMGTRVTWWMIPSVVKKKEREVSQSSAAAARTRRVEGSCDGLDMTHWGLQTNVGRVLGLITTYAKLVYEG